MVGWNLKKDFKAKKSKLWNAKLRIESRIKKNLQIGVRLFSWPFARIKYLNKKKVRVLAWSIWYEIPHILYIL